MDDEQDRAGLERLRRLAAAESRGGKSLAANIEDNPVCAISVDREVPCVVLVWKRYPTSAQLRFIHESVLDLISRYGLRKILGDDTDLPTLHDDDQDWITGNWMPRAVAAGLRFGAYKRAEAYSGKAARARILALAPAGLTLRACDDLMDARR